MGWGIDVAMSHGLTGPNHPDSISHNLWENKLFLLPVELDISAHTR